MQILALLAGSGGGLSLAELSDAAKVPKSSLLNILRALTQTGHVRHSGDQYGLGPQTYRLAASVISARQFPAFARPMMQDLADRAGETVIVGVPTVDGLSTRYIDIVESPQSIRFSARIGSVRPLYLSAGGWILLAYRSDEEISDYLARAELAKAAPTTITDREALRAILRRARQDGFARTAGQSAPDVSGIAAPIFGRDGAVMAALMIAAPHSRIADRADQLVELVVRAAAEISALLSAS